MVHCRRSLCGLGSIVIAVGTACGGGGSGAADGGDKRAAGPRATTYGHGADPSQAVRVVEVKLSDALRFEPSNLDVKKGEIVTLRVTNFGQQAHELTIGDEIAQSLHEAQMLADPTMGMGSMAGMSHAEHMKHMASIRAKAAEKIPDLDRRAPAFESIHVMPGETKELTWAFTGKAPRFGCHLPGHWSGGMRGEVVVS